MVPFVAAACTLPDATPIVVQMPIGSNLPLELAADMHGETQLIVTLSQAGEVTNVAVAQSSGYLALDAAATSVARRAVYRPEFHNCSPVGGSYFLTIDND